MIGSEKIDSVEPIGFQIGPHPIEGRSIEQRAGAPVVNVLRGEQLARDSASGRLTTVMREFSME